MKKKICGVGGHGTIIQSRKEEVLPLPCIHISWELYSHNCKKKKKKEKEWEAPKGLGAATTDRMVI